MRNIAVIILFICFASCEDSNPATEKLILGHWSVTDDYKQGKIKEFTIVDDRAFEFLGDGVVDYKPGYIDYEGFHNDTAGISSKYYLGTRTKFSLKGDSLKIYNLLEKKWEAFKIKKITADTLVIGKDTSWVTFTKKRYDIANVPDFDAVKIYYSPCFGPCPVQQVKIFRNGKVEYDGFYNVRNMGSFKSEISREEFNEISDRFKQANYINLKEDYSRHVTDSRGVIVKFYKGNKIIKTISDYADSSPDEFQWAYIKVEHLIANLKMVKDGSRIARDPFEIPPLPLKK